MSATFSIQDARKALAEDGVYCIQDPTIGSRISEMEKSGSQFLSSTEAGWQFCKLNVLDDARIRAILHPYKWCRLVHYQRFAQDPEHIFRLRNAGEKPDILLIHLCSQGSRGVYFPRSHTIYLNCPRAANRMWEAPLAALTRLGIEAREVAFEKGGMVITNASLAFEMRNVSPVTFGIICGDGLMAEDRLRGWPTLPLPDTVDTNELESKEIGVHFTPRQASKQAEVEVNAIA